MYHSGEESGSGGIVRRRFPFSVIYTHGTLRRSMARRKSPRGPGQNKFATLHSRKTTHAVHCTGEITGIAIHEGRYAIVKIATLCIRERRAKIAGSTLHSTFMLNSNPIGYIKVVNQ